MTTSSRTHGPRDLVFDADGTVVDSLAGAITCANDILSLFGHRPEIATRADMRRAFGRKALAERFGDAEAAQVAAFHPLLMRERARDSKAIGIFPGVIDAVSRLPAPPPIVTAAYAAAVEGVLSGHRPKFGQIQGREHGKKVELLAEVADRALRPVYVCDTSRDVQRCREIGLDCVAVAWGYDDPEVLRAAGAPRIVTDPHQLLNIARGEP